MALGLLATVSVAIVSLLLSLFLEKKKFNIIPVSAFQILLGAIVGFLWLEFYDPTNHASGSHGFALTGFPPELFSSVMLPIIIFEAGWNSLETRKILFHNLFTILAYAVIGTIISTIVVALCIYWILTSLNIQVLSGLDILVLATLISAVDPVATLSVFAQLEAHPLLNVIVFGESVLNDAVAIIMFRALIDFYGETTVNGATVAKIIGKLLLIAFGSTFVGIFTALCGALIMKYAKMQEHPVMEMMFIILVAFLAFFLTEVMHLSGVIAIFFFGIAARHYLSYNLSRVSRNHGDLLFGVLKEFADMMVFVLLGMQLLFFDRQFYDWPLIGATILGCLVGRACNIFPITFLLNCKRQKDNQISAKMQLLMWWAGLRGAVAYVLAMSVPIPGGSSHGSDPSAPPPEIHVDDHSATGEQHSTVEVVISAINATLNATLNATNVTAPAIDQRGVIAREEIITTTHTVIIFTILLLGGPTAPLLKHLKLSGDVAKVSKEEMDGIILRRTDKEKKMLNFDKKYLIPLFSSLENRRQIKKEQRMFREAKLRRKMAAIGLDPYKIAKEMADREAHKSAGPSGVSVMGGPEEALHHEHQPDFSGYDVKAPLTGNTNNTGEKSMPVQNKPVTVPAPGHDSARDRLVQLEEDSSSSSSTTD